MAVRRVVSRSSSAVRGTTPCTSRAATAVPCASAAVSSHVQRRAMTEVSVAGTRVDNAAVGAAAASQRAAIDSILKAQDRTGFFPSPAKDTAGAELATVRAIDEHKDAVTIGCDGFRWTHAELNRQGDALANGLLSCRLRPGHKIINTLDADAEALVTSVAAALSGIAVVPTPGAGAQELLAALEATQAEAVILDPKRIPPQELYEAIPELELYPIGVPFKCARFPNLRAIIHTDYRHQFGMLTLRDIIAYSLVPEHNFFRRYVVPEVTSDRTALLSADGKTAVSQKQLLAAARDAASKLKLTRSDRVVAAGSVVSEWAAKNAVWSTLLSQAMLIVPNKENNHVTSSTPREILQSLSRENATVLVSTVDQLAKILEKPEAAAKYNMATLRTVATVGGAPSADLKAAASKAFGKDVAFVTL